MTLARWIAVAAGSVATLLAAPHVHALEGEDTWGVSFGGGIAHTENLLRLPANVTPAQAGVGDRPRGTWIYNAYARAAIDVPVSRQRFIASVQANTYSYADYSYLNWSGVDYGLAWLWAAGNRWNGTLSYDHRKFLAPLAFFQATTQNLQTVDIARADAEFAIDPRWRLTGGFTGTFIDNSAPQVAVNNVNEYAYGAGFKYLSTEQNFVLAGARYARGEYPNRPFPTASFDNVYDQYDAGIDTSWGLGAKSELVGRLAYTWRKFPNLSQSDFSGPTGRITLNWRLTEKTGLSILVRRDISAAEFVTANYLVTSGGSIAPYWWITPKVQLQGMLDYQDLDYRNFQQTIQEDRLKFANLGATWTPTRNWQIGLAVQYSTRSSNIPNNDFDDVSYFGTVRFGF